MGLRARLIVMLCFVMVLAFGLLLIGVNYGLRNDVNALAQQSAEAGANVLTGVLDTSQQAVRATIQRGAGRAGLAADIAARRTQNVRAAAFEMSGEANLSFVVIVDAHGNVVAGTRPATGSLKSDTTVSSALSGNPEDGPQRFTAAQLRTLGISAPGGTLAIVSAAPIKDDAGHVVGALYGGMLLDSTMSALNDVARFTGGAAGITVNGAFVATSLTGTGADAAPLIGTAVPHAEASAGHATFSGLESVAGANYFVKITPIVSIDGNVIGDYWYGVPFARFESIVTDTLKQIVFWGVIGLVVALAAGTLVAARIGRAISLRSDEVNESAKELRVLVVGGEISGDHVGRTRETLEEIRTLVNLVPSNDGQALQTLAHRAVDDVVVIDTLTSELSSRMRDAAARVERLSAVAQELEQLVAGVRPSRN